MPAAKPSFPQFSIRLSPDDLEFVRELRRRDRAFGDSPRRSLNEVIRTLVSAMRTWFGLPRFMTEALEADMRVRGLDLYGYLQDLLARHYEELSRSSPARERLSEPTAPHS